MGIGVLVDVIVTKGWISKSLFVVSLGDFTHSAQMQSHYREMGMPSRADQYKQEGGAAATELAIEGLTYGLIKGVSKLIDTAPNIPNLNGLDDVAKTGVSAYEAASAGGKHSGFLKNYLGRNADEINKAINTLQSGKRGINTHLDKIANPSKYVPNWDSLRPGHQQSLIKGWQKEITNGTEQIQILKGLLGN